MIDVNSPAARALRALQKLDEAMPFDPIARLFVIEAQDALGFWLALACTGQRESEFVYHHDGDTCPIHEWLVPLDQKGAVPLRESDDELSIEAYGASPGQRDGRIAAQIQEARREGARLEAALVELVGHASEAEANGHVDLYEQVHGELHSSRVSLARAYDLMQKGDPS